MFEVQEGKIYCTSKTFWLFVFIFIFSMLEEIVWFVL